MATEMALTAFLQTGGVGTFFHREIEGKLPAQFSLEIASLEGVLHFFIFTEKKYKALIEANFYSQYPGIEITEADDYTKLVRYEHHKQQGGLWGARYKTKATWTPYPDEKKDDGSPKYPMPADFKPIKTYVDFGLDKDPKEEFKHDPLTPILEFMGNIGKGEYFWYQVMLQESEGLFDGKKFPQMYVDPKTHEHMGISKMAKLYIETIRKKLKYEKGSTAKDEYGNDKFGPDKKDKDGNVIEKGKPITYKEDVYETKSDQQLTTQEKDEIEAITKKLSKPLFRVVVRTVYIFDGSITKGSIGAAVQNILSMFRTLNSPYNSLSNMSPSDPYSYPWQDTLKRRKPWRSEEMYNAYVEREGFFAHVSERKGLDEFEDVFFFPYKTYVRSIWRMFYEILFDPFNHPEAGDVCVLNTEEVATLWHLPGAVANTPKLPRIDSTKVAAPVNLPQ
jgi:hypothetical protein